MQTPFSRRLRRPVKREGAEKYLLVTLVSFGASVTLTRLFLALTGYPQLGGGELHIAHALWGGLLLYIASLLPLMLANRWTYLAGAVLAGTGVGLFIDEVGKFITQSNNYFYPLAAPIVYAFFLLSVLLYLRVRRAPARSVRAELYGAFDSLEEVLESDLDAVEREALEQRLRFVAEQSDRPDLQQLAKDLLEFLRCEALQLAPRRPGLLDRLALRSQAFERSWLTRPRLRGTLVAGLGGLGLVTLARTGTALVLIALVNLTLSESNVVPPPALASVRALVESWQLTVNRGVFRYTDLVLETVVGLLFLFSARMFLLLRESLATAFASIGLLLSLTAVNLLVFYYDQFSSVAVAVVELLLLIGLAYYRQKYLYPQPSASASSPAAVPPQAPVLEDKMNT